MDIETTGLDAGHDDILEVAAVITDDKLQICETYSSFVAGDIDKCDSYCESMHKNSGLWDHYKDPKIYKSTALAVEADLVALIEEHCEPHQAVMAGNSVHFDQRFLNSHMARVTERLSHRLLDVSTLRRAFRMRTGGDIEAKKPHCTHRAVDDVYTAMAEYKNLFDEYDRWVKSN